MGGRRVDGRRQRAAELVRRILVVSTFQSPRARAPLTSSDPRSQPTLCVVKRAREHRDYLRARRRPWLTHSAEGTAVRSPPSRARQSPSGDLAKDAQQATKQVDRRRHGKIDMWTWCCKKFQPPHTCNCTSDVVRLSEPLWGSHSFSRAAALATAHLAHCVTARSPSRHPARGRRRSGATCPS